MATRAASDLCGLQHVHTMTFQRAEIYQNAVPDTFQATTFNTTDRLPLGNKAKESANFERCCVSTVPTTLWRKFHHLSNMCMPNSERCHDTVQSKFRGAPTTDRSKQRCKTCGLCTLTSKVSIFPTTFFSFDLDWVPSIVPCALLCLETEISSWANWVPTASPHNM